MLCIDFLLTVFLFFCKFYINKICINKYLNKKIL